MSTTKEYLAYVKEQLKNPDITSRPMMGEYVIYYRDKVIGGIYDNRFLIKDIKASRNAIDNFDLEIPYDSAKPMIMPDIESSVDFNAVFEAMYAELPLPKKRKKIEK